MPGAVRCATRLFMNARERSNRPLAPPVAEDEAFLAVEVAVCRSLAVCEVCIDLASRGALTALQADRLGALRTDARAPCDAACIAGRR